MADINEVTYNIRPFFDSFKTYELDSKDEPGQAWYEVKPNGRSKGASAHEGYNLITLMQKVLSAHPHSIVRVSHQNNLPDDQYDPLSLILDAHNAPLEGKRALRHA